jgi:hypothetical protein
MLVRVPKDKKLLKYTKTIDFQTAGFIGLLEAYNLTTEFEFMQLVFEQQQKGLKGIELEEVEVFLPPNIDTYFKKVSDNIPYFLLAIIEYKEAQENNRKIEKGRKLSPEQITNINKLVEERVALKEEVKRNAKKPKLQLVGSIETDFTLNNEPVEEPDTNDLEFLNIEDTDVEEDDFFKKLSNLEHQYGYRILNSKDMGQGVIMYDIYNNKTKQTMVIKKDFRGLTVINGGNVDITTVEEFLNRVRELASA